MIGRVLGEVTKEVPGATEGDGTAALRQWLQHQVIPIGGCRSVLPCRNTEQILVGEGQAEGRCGTPPYRSGTGPEVVIGRSSGTEFPSTVANNSVDHWKEQDVPRRDNSFVAHLEQPCRGPHQEEDRTGLPLSASGAGGVLQRVRIDGFAHDKAPPGAESAPADRSNSRSSMVGAP